ncbi:hypothetical protein CPB84DRAFT_1843383 [Gymnopilus junonius]|uniref:Helicase ATP-binding domain-containing protein n=1 Tax=Gymnopilus junonius TaxID=109634 RepID=A0A9P5NWI4_GYMJU|nr:hypothetical protein CPB84DRAFT_1843383 [Gymnopilus junonius]
MTEIKGYIRPVTSLIAMLLHGPSVPLPEVIEKAIKALQTSFGNGTLDEAVSDLEVLLVQLWTQPWLPTKDHHITDPTILYLVFSSILPGGSFKEPKLITNIIACFEYCMHLFSISQIHTHVTQDAGFEEWEPWLQEKVESTFNSLRTLQHLASSIAFGTMSPPRIYWTHCKTFCSMLYKGDPVSFDCIQAMLSDNEKMLKDVWEQELLFSLDLSVQYESIKDDLSNITPGYGFVTDHHNSCFSDSNLLLSSILNISQLKDRFIALEHKGIMVWKAHELKTWLSSYAKFHLALITRVNLTADHQHTRVSTQKFSGHGHHIVLLVTYLKTSSMTGFDHLIPHSLDAFSSNLLIQDLAIARLFARLAARICHQTNASVHCLYDNYIFVNHTTSFKTDDITNALRRMSAHHFDHPFGVNGWHHISTAFQCMNCSCILELVEDSGNDTIQALQSGHCCKTENWVYGLSPDVLAGASEDVLPLFLDASTDWQMECKVIPGGLVLSYRSALMSSFDKLVAKEKVADVEAPLKHVTKDYLNSQPKGQSQSALLAESASLEEPESSQPSTLVERDSPLVQDGLECVLHKPDANWTCSEQLEEIKAMLRLKKDVLAILPTGAGKTMLVIIPSLLEKDQITVLFDSSKHLSGSTNLVLVSANIVKTTGWKQAIAELSQCIPVVHQIFDESHIPVTSSSFRPALLNMSDIRVQFPTQIVLLSATVPKAMEPYLIHDFGFGENHFILRTQTNRPELEYHWMSPQMENHLPESISSLIKATLKLPQD